MLLRFCTQVMVVFFCLFLIFAFHSCIRGPLYEDLYSIGDITEPPMIRVGLSQTLEVPSAKITIQGPFEITELGGAIITKSTSVSNATLVPIQDEKGLGLLFEGKAFYAAALRFVPLNDGGLYVQKRRYHGSLIVHVYNKTRLSLINELSLEKYLTGVVGREMRLSAYESALKAQLIAARTFALCKIRRKLVDPTQLFDVYDDQRDQVYGGMDDETEQSKRLTFDTRGTVVTYKGEIFKAFYSSTCGGQTEPAWLVFNEGSELFPLSGVKCGYCQNSKYYRWKATISKKDMAQKLFGNSAKSIRSLRISKTAPGGHALQIEIALEQEAAPHLLNAYEEFRKKLNAGVSLRDDQHNLRSTWFTVQDLGHAYQFTGLGWGHAVGLCQIGAMRMAELGSTSEDTLRYYYPGCSVMKIY